MSDYFDQLETELRAAVPRLAADRRGWRGVAWGSRGPAWGWRGLAPQWRRPSLGVIAAGLSAAVAVAVVVGAVALLGHAHPASPPSPAVHGPKPPAVRRAPPPALTVRGGSVPTLAQLLANFAVLRRPVTAADRSWPGPGGVGERLVIQRQAARLPNGDRVFLTVGRQVAGPPQARPYALSIYIVQPNGNASGTDFGPQVQYNVFPISSPVSGTRGSGPPRPGTVTWAGLVPDGVSTVHWTFGCVVSGRCADRTRLTVVVPVVDNVASLTTVAGSGDCSTCRMPTSVSWYGPNGRPEFSFSTALRRNLTVPPFVKEMPPVPPVVRRVLQATGIAGVQFGASPPAVIRALTPLLGAPAGSGAGGGCGVTRSLVWPAASGLSSQPRPASRLLAYFAGRRFVGYQYGDQKTRTAADLSGAGVRLATAAGLQVGDTLSRGWALYGHTFLPLAAQGGTWRADGTRPHGVRGYVFDLPGHRPVDTRNLVATIDAGDVGCPAVSP